MKAKTKKKKSVDADTGTADDRIAGRTVDAIRKYLATSTQQHDAIEGRARELFEAVGAMREQKTIAEDFIYRQLESFFRFRNQEKEKCQKPASAT